ncbi:hybrid sensor histidine kinase/response regulator [Butyrivibrio sp. INlla16]|uniref:hybrid sensor histidine kinase/response regulator n=1 Tax=Butyrivibrio sp. INlla16 TaxID=1520807 RepID=UPI00088EF5A0|nr:hybrid sensor histidine kinase/response regulator [Butyrivibrio sp. INlla16]SDB10063.1 Signal transduction histidine kinase [Butyrivibrio sp. INlla16]
MKSIRTKFTLLTVCTIVIAVIIVAAIAVYSINKLGNSDADEMLFHLCEAGQKNLNAYFDSAEHSVTKIAGIVEENLERTSDDQLGDHVERMRTAFEKVMYQTNGVLTYYYRIDPAVSKKIKGFWYSNPDGEGFREHEMIDMTLYDTNDTSELPWFTIPKVTGEPVWISPYITDIDEVRVISYNVPVYWKNEFIGVIGAEIDYSLMSSEVRHITLYDNGYAFIADEAGNLVYHPHIDATILTDMSRPDVPPGLLTAERHYRYTVDGEEKMGVWLPLDNGMRLHVTVPASEINRTLRKMVVQIMIASVFLLIVLSYINRRFALRLTKPLNDLTKATEQINSGNFDVELNYSGDDEVGILTKTFSNLAKNLQTEIHALAESEQASRAKSSFLSNMSHEIRTPITTVLGMNEIISRETNDETILGYCDNIRIAGNNLLGIINDILDFSKIEAGKMELIPASYSLKDLIGDLYSMLQIRAGDKGLSLRLDIDPHLPKELVGDALRIKQVITNLLTNAIKYTEKGSVTFKVALKEKDEKKATIYVAVIDTGIGIKEEEMYKLFEKFDRLDTKRTKTIEGTGLGLAITRKLLVMMGTDIDAKSTYNVGSTFSFILEQEISDPAEIGQLDEKTVSIKDHMRLQSFSFVAPDSHILIVDDTPMNLEVIKGLLKPTQIQITTATSGAECIELFSANFYDLVFLDYRMPQMNGVETLNALKEKVPEKAAATPIISLTANAIQGDRERMIAAGFTDYLTKPVNISDMDAVLLKYLPENLISQATGDEAEAEDPYEGIPEEAFACSWLDPKEGVEYCGSGPMYMDALEFFANATERNANVIEKSLADGDIELYTTKVHALKSSSLSIGMKDFSARAKALELAGKSNDIETIKRDTPDFLKSYREFREDLLAILAKAAK